MTNDPCPSGARLVLLPPLRADADPRPALLPMQPRAVPVIYASVGAALDALCSGDQGGCGRQSG